MCLIAPAIKAIHPEWHVSWIVDEDFTDVVRLCDGIDEIISFPRKNWRQRSPLSEIFSWFRQLIEKKFDVTLDLQGLARTALMSAVACAERRIGLASAREFSHLAYNEIVQDRAPHAVDRYRQAVAQLVGKTISETYRLRLPPVAENIGLLSQKYIVLHPYSLWETKLWPWDHYTTLTSSLPQETFVLVGRGEFFPCSGANIIDVRNQTSLSELLSILAHAKAVVSTDSGPAHLSAALGRPVVSLFGASDPQKTAPRSPQSVALFKKISCQPCVKRICRHSNVMECVKKITVEDARNALVKIIE